MTETQPHKLGMNMAENMLKIGTLFYDSHRKANFFRGLMRGLIKHKWIREIVKEEQIYWKD